MAVLYLTEQGAIVRKTGDRLIVEKEHETLTEIPCAKIESVLIFGNVQVTTPALAELLDQGIELAFLTVSGRLRGQLTPPKAKNLPLRMRQYDAARDDVFRLDIAREIDPYLGFFHEEEYGRPSLALDLLEEFRAPLVDRFAATVLALGQLTRADFVAGPEGGVVLSRDGLKSFFTAWENGLAEPIALAEGPASFRELFRRQAERLARALTQGEPYRAFRLFS